MIKKRKNVIAIISPKGGVGKTVTTANLATALAFDYNKKVLAIDTNVSTASLGIHFDVFYPKNTIHDVLEKNSVKGSIHIYHENLHLIPASIKIRKKDKNLKMMRENFYNMIKNYEKILDDVSNDYDIILLDCSPGFDLETMAAMEVAGGMIIITNPDYPSIVSAARAIEYAQRIKMPVGGIVLNKVTKKRYELRKDNIEKSLNLTVLAEIPYDKRIPESIAARKPVVLFKKNSKSAKAYKKLAAFISGEDYKKPLIKKFFGYFKKELKNIK